MKIFAISDLHLSLDPRIEKPMDAFGDRWVNHVERLEANWRDAIGPEDLVLLPGDLSWGLRLEEAMADIRFIDALPGTKVLVKGNHDLWWTARSHLQPLSDRLYFLQNDCLDTGDGVVICGSRGWICPGSEGFDEHDEKIFRRECMRLEMSLQAAKALGPRRIIACLHYPPTNDKHQGSALTDLLTKYQVETCVYGHLHGPDVFPKGLQGVLGGVTYRLVSLDYLEAKPLCLLDTAEEV